MIDIKKKTVDGESVTVPPPVRAFQGAADKTVGLRTRVTPEMATEWLETRGNNRKVMQSVVDTYVGDMRAGRWLYNGQPIQFDEEGKLLNGQHRLWAVIESGKAQEFVVQWGIPRAHQETIDAGAAWKGKDILYMAGEKNCSALAASLRWIAREEAGSVMTARGMSNAKAKDVLSRHPNIRRSVDFIAGQGRSLLQPGISAYVHYKVAGLSRERADEFFVKLATGTDLSINDPIYRLRERLIRHQTTKEKLDPIDALALTIVAWNHFYKGDSVRSLQWRKSGPTAQPFPVIEALYGSAHFKRIKTKQRKVS